MYRVRIFHSKVRVWKTRPSDHVRSRTAAYQRSENRVTKSISERLEESLPAIVEGTGDVGKVVVATSLAFAIQSDPAIVSTAIGASLLTVYMDRTVRKVVRMLADQFRKRNLQRASIEQQEALVPMMYKYLEAAREGEYDKNLRILASYLSAELQLKAPDASNFSRMVRRVEGLSATDLKVLAMVDATYSDFFERMAGQQVDPERVFVSATALQKSEHNRHSLSLVDVQEAIIDLAARGFLRVDGASRMSKAEEYYFPTRNLFDLMNRARDQVEEPAID